MEKRIEELHHLIYDDLLQNASYLGKENIRYYPVPSVFEQFVWNIVIALLVNLFANYLHERYFSREEMIQRTELKKITQEIIREIENKKDIKVTDTALKSAESEVRKLLVENGWPEDTATKDSEKIVRNVKKWLRSYRDG